MPRLLDKFGNEIKEGDFIIWETVTVQPFRVEKIETPSLLSTSGRPGPTLVLHVSIGKEVGVAGNFSTLQLQDVMSVKVPEAIHAQPISETKQ